MGTRNQGGAVPSIDRELSFPYLQSSQGLLPSGVAPFPFSNSPVSPAPLATAASASIGMARSWRPFDALEMLVEDYFRLNKGQLSSASFVRDCPLDVTNGFSTAVDPGFISLWLRSTCPRSRRGSTTLRTSCFKCFTSVSMKLMIS